MEAILIVDDEAHIRNNLREFLEDYEITDVDSREKVEEVIKTRHFDYAIIDLKLDNSSEYGGVEVFRLMKQAQPTVHCIILSAYPLEGEVERQFNESLKNEPNSDMNFKRSKRELHLQRRGAELYLGCD